MKKILLLIVILSTSIMHAMEEKRFIAISRDIQFAKDVQDTVVENPLSDKEHFGRRVTINHLINKAIKKLQADKVYAQEQGKCKLYSKISLLLEQLIESKNDILAGTNRNQTPPLVLDL